ncbi:MAG: tRNA-uridine aminocarboxypropyltransferase [Pseudobdellovibrionaceae bacterium]
MASLGRKRKTKDPCQKCFLHKSLCLCGFIPSINLKTKVSLVIHAKELKRTTNTGRLALHALTNSEMRVRGATQVQLDLSDLLDSSYRTLFFYPSDDAIPLTKEFVLSDPRPIQLIVPDGNWRQASKVQSRHPELRDVPRIKMAVADPSSQHMRAEHKEAGMATLQAIACALGEIEGEEVKNTLLSLYTLKLERTLKGRGVPVKLQKS